MKGDIVIIDNYADLMIGDYIKIIDITRNEALDEIDKQVAIICILTGKTEEEVLALPIPTYHKLALKLAFLSGKAFDQGGRFADSYNTGDFVLVPVKDMRKVTTSQYIDFQSLHQAGFEEHFVEILSCILVPKGKKYCQDYEILDVQNAIRNNMSVLEGASVYAFFLISCKQSLKDILTFSLKQAKKLTDKAEREKAVKEIQAQLNLLTGNGDGSQA